MIRSLLMLAACLLCVPLAACQTAAEQCAQAANPTECVKVADAGGDVSDYLTYGMAGYMLSSMVNGGGQRQAVMEPDPHYNGYRRSIPSYQASREYVRNRTVTTTTTNRGLFGGSKTTTTVARYASRPSSSGHSYRSSSYRSFSRGR